MARRKALDRILATARSHDAEERREALWCLARYRFDTAHPTARQRRQSLNTLIRALVADPDESVRFEAAHALSYCQPAKGQDHRTAGVLLDVLDDEGAPPRLRGQAAESSSTYLQFRSPGALRRRASALFLRFLRDPEPEVRFWCIYAMGQARMTEARSLLEEIARTDDAVCPAMWRVRDEAADVLTFFDGGAWPDRVPGRIDESAT